MAFDAFAAPLEKIERAKHHITDLNGKINAYMAKRPFRLMVRQYPELSELHAVVDTYIPIPADFSFIIGDAIHNLRSSLDIMIFGLIGGQVAEPDKVSFPISKSRDGLHGAITRRQVQIAGERVVAAIKSLEPYPDGKYGLYGLHELDIRDKHRLILPAWRNAEIKATDLKKIHRFFDFNRADSTTFNFRMDPDQPVLAAVQFQPERFGHETQFFEEEAKVQPIFKIAFDKGHSLASMPVVETLGSLVNSCTVAISKIRDAVG